MRSWLFMLHDLPGPECPIAVLLVPDHQHADRDWVGLAVAFGFTHEGVPHDGGIADDVGGLVGRAHCILPAISQGTPGQHMVDIRGA